MHVPQAHTELDRYIGELATVSFTQFMCKVNKVTIGVAAANWSRVGVTLFNSIRRYYTHLYFVKHSIVFT